MKSKLNQVLEVGDVVAWAVKVRSNAIRFGIIANISDSGILKAKVWGTNRWDERLPASVVKLDRLSIPGYVEERKRIML